MPLVEDPNYNRTGSLRTLCAPWDVVAVWTPFTD